MEQQGDAPEREDSRIKGQGEVVESLVSDSKQRIERADDYARQQALERVQNVTARIDAINEQKELLSRQRMTDAQDYLIDKSTLQATISSIRNTDPEKTNRVLRSLGLPPMSNNKEAEKTSSSE